MKIGIFGSNYQSDKFNTIKRVFNHLRELGVEVWIETEFFEYLSERFEYQPYFSGLIQSDDFQCDVILSLGGDGTFLRTAAWVGKKGIPILGINTGRLGFLADVNSNDIEDTLSNVFKNYYQTEDRSLLYLQTDAETTDEYPYALNEIAILKRDTSSMITIRVYLNNEFLTNYLADGLLVATPTGSTAYSMSVNGPIIIPQAKNIVLSPVAPHSLNVRPLVIPEDYVLSLEVDSRDSNFLVALDGRSQVVSSGTKFTITKADFTTKIVKRFNHTFYQTLREKLNWGADAREIST